MNYQLHLVRRHFTSLFLLALLFSETCNAAKIAALTAKFDHIPGDKAEFLAVDKAFQLLVSADDKQVNFHWQIAPGYYLYKHRIYIESIQSPAQIFRKNLHFVQEAKLLQDPNYGLVPVYRDRVDATLDLQDFQKIAQSPLDFIVHYQGCVNAGLCYPLQGYHITVSGSVGNLKVDIVKEITRFDARSKKISLNLRSD